MKHYRETVEIERDRETLRNIQDMLWICCRTRMNGIFIVKKFGSQIWNNSLRVVNKKIRRDSAGRTRKNNHQNYSR